MGAPSSPGRTVGSNDVVIVSDLHMGPPGSDSDREAARRRDGAFERFTAAAREEASAAGRSVGCWACAGDRQAVASG